MQMTFHLLLLCSASVLISALYLPLQLRNYRGLRSDFSLDVGSRRSNSLTLNELDNRGGNSNGDGTSSDQGSGNGEDVTSNDQGSGSSEDVTSNDQGSGNGEDLTSNDQGSGSSEVVTSNDQGCGSSEDVTSNDQGSGNGEDVTSNDQGSGNGEDVTLTDQGRGNVENVTSNDQGSGNGENVTLTDQGSGNGEVVTLSDQGRGNGEDVTLTDQGSGNGEDVTSNNQGSGNCENVTLIDQGIVNGEDVTSSDQGSGNGKVVTLNDQGSGNGKVVTLSDQGRGNGEDVTSNNQGSRNGEVVTSNDQGSGNGEDLILGEDVTLGGYGSENIKLFSLNGKHYRDSFVVLPYSRDTDPVWNLLTRQSNFKETIIFLKKTALTDLRLYNQEDNSAIHDCTSDTKAGRDPCAIPFKQQFLSLNTYSFKRDRQAQGDLYLSWALSETGHEKGSKRTPAVLTSNVKGDANFSPLNTFGSNYWMVRVQMDCSKTSDGYFEVKGYYGGQQEPDVSESICIGNAGGSPALPARRGGHLARCGYLNVFSWGESNCHIQNIPLQ